ncbi:GNAT family N-acetyltransferase [Bacillus salitolerans]|uniref:GNAT family N-acetyltransferase n=1 Tax=Bacillus salitolerans TaxID=1437434 RepID=A0ABW4LW99_9BACI
MTVRNDISYRRLEELEDINQAVRLQAEIWGLEVVSPQPQLVASIHHGGVVIGAFTDHQLVGFCYGFAGYKDKEVYLISHMTGILPDYQNAGIGYQLKIQQREWAIDYGYKKIVWTYDPLEIRNGYFNICKLGAYSKHYIPSYYGEMNDKLNKGLPTDRLLIEWDICSKRAEAALRGAFKNQTETNYESLLSFHQNSDDPTPLQHEILVKENQGGYRVPVPSTIQLIKKQNPNVAHKWRYAVRHALHEAFSKGYMITGVQRELDSKIHFYILEKRGG